MLNRFMVAALVASLASVASTAAIIRRATELDESYDFIIAGGGTAGLTIADRVSAAFPDRTVLVVEYGNWNPKPSYGSPTANDWDHAGAFVYNQPIPTLGNRTPRSFMVGKTLGGSSAINGNVFDRASRHNYDAWANYSEAADWNWEGLYPYFKKSSTLIEPTEEQVAEYGYTWEADAWGSTTPLNATFAAFQWPSTAISRKAWEEVGCEVRTDCANGDKAGLCWSAQTHNQWDGSRTHAGISHYTILENRTNLHVVINHKVTRVLYSGEDIANEIPTVEVQYLNDSSIYNVTARAEVIISAGVVHSPQILQRSGLGPAALLEEAGIDVVLDLPGVGYNFQDHTAAQFAVSAANDLKPNALERENNATYAAEALAEYALRPAQGPWTMDVANTAAFPALNVVTDEYAALAAAVREQANNGSATQYLPSGTPDTVIAGYLEQMLLIADAMENPEVPFLEGWTSGLPQYATLLHPLSRGSILINTTDLDAEPIINFNTVNNPLDIEILLTFIPFMRKVWATDAFKDLGLVETSPGANVTERADLVDWLINDALQQSDYHPCCTVAMAPLAKGGVVGADLRVHGLNKLRVADFSTAPMELGTHTQSTAYAIGEKAADLIIADYS